MHKNFFMVPNRIFKQELRPRDFMVYCCLLSHCDKNMTCFPSRQLISRECRIDKKTVDAAIKNLIDNNLISKGPRTRWNGANSSNMYFVNNLLEDDGMPDAPSPFTWQYYREINHPHPV